MRRQMRRGGRGGGGEKADERVVHICTRVYLCVTYSESYRTTPEASRSNDTAGHRYMEKISAQAVVRKTDALCCDSREKEREAYLKK